MLQSPAAARQRGFYASAQAFSVSLSGHPTPFRMLFFHTRKGPATHQNAVSLRLCAQPPSARERRTQPDIMKLNVCGNRETTQRRTGKKQQNSPLLIDRAEHFLPYAMLVLTNLPMETYIFHMPDNFIVFSVRAKIIAPFDRRMP